VAPGTLTKDYLSRVLLASAGSFEMMSEVIDCDYFWVEPDWRGPDAANAAARLSASGRFELVGAVIDALESVPSGEQTFTAVALRDALDKAAVAAGCKPATFHPLLRYCVTGQRSGAPVLNIIEVVGKERALARLRAAPSAPTPPES
jgi:glutamyl/glutaminyl-tRNA synthetase